MDGFVTLLFLSLWIAVAFFVLRFAGRLYFHEPRRADAAALGVAIAFALGTLWPYSARLGRGPTSSGGVPVTSAAATESAGQTVAATIIGSGRPPGSRDVSAACRTAKGPLGASSDGSIDDLRSDAAASTLVADGGRMDAKTQYIVEGWAAEPAEARPAQWVCLVIDGKIETRGKVYFGVSRPDVASGFHHEELTPSGYTIAITPGLLTRGKHRIEVVAEITGGKLLILPAVRNVTVF